MKPQAMFGIGSLAVALFLFLLNATFLTKQHLRASTGMGMTIASDFYSASTTTNDHGDVAAYDQHHRVVSAADLATPDKAEDTTSTTSTTTTQSPPPTTTKNNNNSSSNNKIRPKTLVGIISSDTFSGAAYRSRHRELFQIWNDTRVCPLWKFQQQPQLRSSCELIYTFVIGANQDSDAPTEIVDASVPLLVEKPTKVYRDDVNGPDTTLLNIRENMNEGKSQTFLYFASLQMKEYGIDYVMKLDADALLHLHDYFLFSHHHLPPAPYNSNIFGGALRDKAYWPKPDPSDLSRKESYWGNEYEGVHLYLAGQMYLLSYDLAMFVVSEAPYSRERIAKGGYMEGHEDHDISAMAFHSPTPVHLLTIAKSQRFWEHPVKGEPRWKRIVKREEARMSGTKFEGRILRTY